MDEALAAAHAQLLHAREELAQRPARSFQEAFLEGLRGPYEAAALAHAAVSSRARSGETKWRRTDLRGFLSSHFPQYAQQPAAFTALCASLAAKQDGDETSDDVLVTFDALRRVLVRQYCSTRLVAKDPYPLEPCAETKPAERRPIVPPLVVGSSGNESGSDDATTSLPELHEFQTDVLKKSQSWLGRWRARHLVLRWGALEMHKRSLAARSFRHVHSSANSSSTSTGTSSDGSSSSSSLVLANAGATAKTTKMYDLSDLVLLKLEQLSEGDSVRNAALTIQFQTPLKPSSNSHSNPTSTASQDIKTLILGGGGNELVAVRDHVATFALFLELSRRDRAPSMTQVRRFVEAGAQVNVRVHIPRVSLSRDSREGLRRRSQAGKPSLNGTLTALQLAFLQDPHAHGFKSLIALLLNAGADPRSLLHWEYATHVFFSTPSTSTASSEKMEQDIDEHLQRRILRKRLLLHDTIENDDGDNAAFPCSEVQADDGVRWNLLMYFCWHADLEDVQHLLNMTGLGSSQGNQSRMSSRQLLTCLDHVNAAGDTALHIAIKVKSEPVALLLVEAALSTNAQAVHQCDARGEPVVHLALTARQWRVVDALVAGGAVDPRSYDAMGNTALHLAIQLRAPVALVARLIQVYRHSPPTGGLDGRAGRRGGNDTPMSLALKSGQQEVVALLLASGASPAGSDCQWNTAFRDKQRAQDGQNVDGKRIIGDDDSALHVAIKSGMELAAAALIAHKADIYAVDSRGASPLALAIRHGLYALAAALAEQHQKRHHQSLSKHWWVDGETGRPVSMLAIQAGQLELAALLLDYSSQDRDTDHQMYPSRLLPLLVQMSVWLDTSPSVNTHSKRSSLSRRSSGQDHGEADRKSGKQKKVRSSSSNSIPSTWTRDRGKSRSDSDWKHLQRESSRRSGGEIPTARSCEEPVTTKQERNECVFLLRGIQALVLRFLQLSNKSTVADVVGGGTAPSSVSLSTLPLLVHLPTTAATSAIQPRFFKDDELTACSPLHVAASGGRATYKLLRLLLAFLLSVDPSDAVQVLVRPMGSRAETPLHAALTAGAAENALMLLYSSRELQARRASTSALCAHLYEMPNLLGDSALHLASAWPCNAAMRLVVELLLQENVDAGTWNNAGLAPLHVALRQGGDDAFIELFLRYGQDLNLWTEGSIYEDDEPGSFFETGGSRPSAMTLVASCPQNPLMLSIETENSVAFRTLVRGGARTRALMPRARIGLLQLAVHCNVCNPELLACMLDDLELERSAQSDTADQWGVTPRDARSKLMEIWRKERSGDNAERPPEDYNSADKDNEDNEHSQGGKSQQQRPPPLHPASAGSEWLISKASSSDDIDSSDAVEKQVEFRIPPPLRITVPKPTPVPVALETAQYLRALPRPPTLSPTTLEYLREEERATLTLVAQEARTEAQDWLAKRIGQKKLLSDARAQLQNVQKHKRSASGSSVNSSKDDMDALAPDASGRLESTLSDQQLLEELKTAAAKRFIDKHVAEIVTEARLAIEREKQTIFQETGLYPGATSASKKNKKRAMEDIDRC